VTDRWWEEQLVDVAGVGVERTCVGWGGEVLRSGGWGDNRWELVDISTGAAIPCEVCEWNIYPLIRLFSSSVMVYY